MMWYFQVSIWKLCHFFIGENRSGITVFVLSVANDAVFFLEAKHPACYVLSEDDKAKLVEKQGRKATGLVPRQPGCRKNVNEFLATRFFFLKNISTS